MIKARTVSELLKYTYRSCDAYLEVVGKNGNAAWKEKPGFVELNIENKRFPVISRECFEKIAKCLVVKQNQEK